MGMESEKLKVIPMTKFIYSFRKNFLDTASVSWYDIIQLILNGSAMKERRQV